METSPTCKRDLLECQHCGCQWATQESLDAHLRNPKGNCFSLNNIPSTISIIKPAQSVSFQRALKEPVHLEEDEPNIKVCQEGVAKKATINRTSTFLKPVIHTDDSTQNLFLEKCQDPSMTIRIPVDEIITSEKNLSSMDKLVVNLLEKTTLCIDGEINLQKSVNPLRMEFRNILAWYSMNGDIVFLPGWDEHTVEISNDDLIPFLQRHLVLTTGSTSPSPDHHEDQETRDIGSMVFDVEMSADVQDNDVFLTFGTKRIAASHQMLF